jgi:hypothetical protein
MSVFVIILLIMIMHNNSKASVFISDPLVVVTKITQMLHIISLLISVTEAFL